MDCNYTTIKTCELKGSTFRSHVLNFGDFDISEYAFSAGFSNGLGQKLNDVQLEKFGNSVILPLTSIENRSGRFRSDVWMETEGNKDLAVRFDISISDTNCGCTDDTTHDITITYQELVIPVTVTQSVVNINLDYESLTPEQQSDLRFDYEDFTPENILELQQPAIEAATLANTATQNANEATENAQFATEEAQTATTAANEATADATIATNNANTAAGFATSATQEATAAASSANSATIAANTATGNANDATTAANTATGNAQSAANEANDINNAVQLAENTRISNETTRVNQESTRQTNESGRVTAEDTRVSAESLRVGAESSRVTAENTRVSAENTRISNETTRQTNETTRVNAEGTRVSAESLRVSAENARILAEENRQGRELVAVVTLNNSFEIKIQSIDYATGIFTTTAPHGLWSNARLSPISDLNSGVNFPPSVMPDGLPPGQYAGGLIIHDTTRFSINGVTMTSHAGVDFSKWHFENANGANNVVLTGLNADYYEVEIIGRILNNISYLNIDTNRVNLSTSIEHMMISGASGSAVGLNRSGLLAYTAHVYYSNRIELDGRNGLIVRQEAEAIGSQTGANAKTQNVYYTDKRITLDSRVTGGATQILRIGTGTGTGFANGTKVFLYKRK